MTWSIHRVCTDHACDCESELARIPRKQGVHTIQTLNDMEEHNLRVILSDGHSESRSSGHNASQHELCARTLLSEKQIHISVSDLFY